MTIDIPTVGVESVVQQIAVCIVARSCQSVTVCGRAVSRLPIERTALGDISVAVISKLLLPYC